ncbi:MAG TPA: ARMT1-like domain-containing protein [bacterium]|nr:ARMT1-like domain-containing protein [bacterium]
MKTYLDCFPCILQKTLQAARQNQLPDEEQKAILDNVLQMLRETSADVSPPQISHQVHQLIRESTGMEDPYEQIKLEYDVRALDLMPNIRQKIRKARDPLEAAIRYAIAGTVLDIGADHEGDDIRRELDRAPEAEFGINHLENLKQDLRAADTILYLGDNAGEIAFDRLLVEVLRDMFRAEIVFVVRGQPVLNDATIDDARYVGLESLVHLIANESTAPTTLLEDTGSRTREYIKKSDVILAKGQAQYESLSNADLNLYFLFKVNCGVISQDLGAEMSQYVVAGRRILSTSGE